LGFLPYRFFCKRRRVRSQATTYLGGNKRLLEAHRVDFRLSSGDKGIALDLIEAVVLVEQRDVGIATVGSGDP
jgi:hypothetical protein